VAVHNDNNFNNYRGVHNDERGVHNDCGRINNNSSIDYFFRTDHNIVASRTNHARTVNNSSINYHHINDFNDNYHLDGCAHHNNHRTRITTASAATCNG
jgi:hypothetical protein